jgi:peroxiredoxin
MPEMQRVYDDLKEKGFTILAVNVYPSRDDARRFIEENGFTFPVVQDDTNVVRKYEVSFIPKTLVIDRQGIIRQVHVGSLKERQLREMVEPWL